MNQEKETSYVEKITITSIALLLLLGILGGWFYLFFPRPTLDSAMVDFCKEWGGELRTIHLLDECKGGKCVAFGCYKEDITRSYKQVESEMKEFNKK